MLFILLVHCLWIYISCSHPILFQELPFEIISSITRSLPDTPSLKAFRNIHPAARSSAHDTLKVVIPSTATLQDIQSHVSPYTRAITLYNTLHLEPLSILCHEHVHYLISLGFYPHLSQSLIQHMTDLFPRTRQIAFRQTFLLPLSPHTFQLGPLATTLDVLQDVLYARHFQQVQHLRIVVMLTNEPSESRERALNLSHLIELKSLYLVKEYPQFSTPVVGLDQMPLLSRLELNGFSGDPVGKEISIE